MPQGGRALAEGWSVLGGRLAVSTGRKYSQCRQKSSVLVLCIFDSSRVSMGQSMAFTGKKKALRSTPTPLAVRKRWSGVEPLCGCLFPRDG